MVARQGGGSSQYGQRTTLCSMARMKALRRKHLQMCLVGLGFMFLALVQGCMRAPSAVPGVNEY